MAWARVDDGWWAHPKVLTLDLDARGLWVSVLSWSCQQQTDHVPAAVATLCGDDGTAAEKLVQAGLWENNGAGWVIHDWDDYQSERAKKAAAGRKGGRASGESRRQAKADEADERASLEADQRASREADREADAGTSDEAGPSRPDPSRPDEDTSWPDGHPDPAAESFELFWSIYPARDGKKRGKTNALIEWRKRTEDERRRAYRGAKYLAASDDLPKDAERFLRRAKGGKGDFPFDDYQSPPSNGRPDPPPDGAKMCLRCGHPEDFSAHLEQCDG